MTKIRTGQVTPSSEVYATWTPSFTNITVGNGVVTARYIQIGKLIECRLTLVFGSTTSLSGDVSFTLPVTAIAYPGGTNSVSLGIAQFNDNSASAGNYGSVQMNSTTKGIIRVSNSIATYDSVATLSSTIPFTWAVSDDISVVFSYEAA